MSIGQRLRDFWSSVKPRTRRGGILAARADTGFGRSPDGLSTGTAARLIDDFAWRSAGIRTGGAGGRIPVALLIRRAGSPDLDPLVDGVEGVTAFYLNAGDGQILFI